MHAGPRHRLGARGRGRPEDHHPRQCAAHPQSDDRRAVRARPRDAFLSLCMRSIGWTWSRRSRPIPRRLRRSRNRSRAMPAPRRAISPMCRIASRSWSNRASSAFSRTPIGATRSTSCRRRRTSWPWRIIWMRSSGRGRWPSCTRSSAARTRTRISWSAASPPRSACTAAPAPAPPRSTQSACSRWRRSSSKCAASSMRCTCPTRWRSPPSTRTGSRPAKAPAIS